MMSPQAYEQLVHWRQEQLSNEAAAERLAAEARLSVPGIRRRLAISLCHVAAWLSAEVAEAVADARTAASIRAIATCNGVEYWRPIVSPLPR